MRVYRAARRFDTAIVRRDGALDRRLSWEAVGLLYFVLCQEDGWEGDVASLVDARPGGRDRMQRILRELRTMGYAVLRKQSGGGRGKAPRWYYEFYDIPHMLTEGGDSGYQGPPYQAPEKPAAYKEGTNLYPEYVGTDDISGERSTERGGRSLPLAPTVPNWTMWPEELIWPPEDAAIPTPTQGT